MTLNRTKDCHVNCIICYLAIPARTERLRRVLPEIVENALPLTLAVTLFAIVIDFPCTVDVDGGGFSAPRKPPAITRTVLLVPDT
ncbi:hypothetical protein Y032_0541g3193 [Ancylostoma ceylanicum]|uniref:Uncharacterized protein n=1 Tax=Ancylostoma ceylanicum TaxID=53326 RepID=A0A016WQS6_9BILA|nr:hypothetical protein Y032_0541g3193 [Ancylostoma ceylanicum]